jgi:hypothetical protein
MPSDDRLGLDDSQSGFPVTPAPQPHPEEAISGRQLQAVGAPHGELLPLGEVLQPELSADLAQRGKGVQHDA